MLKRFLEEALKTGMDAYLNQEARSRGNKRNDKKTQAYQKLRWYFYNRKHHKIEQVNLNRR